MKPTPPAPPADAPGEAPAARGRSTIALHGGREAGDLPRDTPVATPLVQSVTFEQPRCMHRGDEKCVFHLSFRPAEPAASV